MGLKVHIVIPSINQLDNFRMLRPTLEKYDHKIIVVDEGNEKFRHSNSKLLQGLSYSFFGPRERKNWFKQRFGSSYEKYLSVIPEKCHAESSFGFLIAYEEEPDLVIELDDDVFPVEGQDLVNLHWKNLMDHDGVIVMSKNKWYNTIENLILDYTDERIFPRGHPYESLARMEDYTWEATREGSSVLNMGLWLNHPDLDAVTILYHGGMDGRCNIHAKSVKREKIIVGKGTYFAICSMNCAFRTKIIPAFYQLYMNHLGVDRFDDIWSGIFLKKVADHIGDSISLGKPAVYHNKRPRSVFKDLRSEFEGILMNEKLWKIIDNTELSEKDYFNCTSELADSLQAKSDEFNTLLHRKFAKLQSEKIRLWLKIIDRIK